MVLILTGCPRYRTTLESYQSNPSYTKRQALDICKSVASISRSNAENNYKARNRNSGGGFWGGMAQGASQSREGGDAYDTTLKGCLAEKGWYTKRVRIN